MFFRCLRKSASVSLQPPQALPLSTSRSAEQHLVEALTLYRQEFIGKIEPALDPRADDAMETVSRAKRIAGDSGIGPALAPTLLEEVRYWPSWSQRDDFQKWVHFPAIDVFGSDEKDERGHKITRVYFRYKECQYGVYFVDEGCKAWEPINDDPSYYGKVELTLDGQTVLGLDIQRKMFPDHARWRWTNVFAFTAGAWMKDLIEIASYIELDMEYRLDTAIAEDVIERASGIKF